MKFLRLALMSLAAASALPAQQTPPTLRLPAILSDNMVLQEGMPVKIWGWAPPSRPVTVSLAGQKKSATAGPDGRWLVTLDPLKSGGGPLEMSVQCGSTLTVKNILVGEVWLASGQSNMQFTLREAANSQAEIAAAKFPSIRLFKTKFHAPQVPQEDVVGAWVECSPETAAGFSAVAFFFGRKLHAELKVPVGLIQSAQGATAAEYWVSKEALESDPALKPIADRFEAMPKDPKGWDMHLPTGLFNGEIAPLARFGIRGVIWYQGETNGGRAFQYRTLFPVLIRDWRRAWGYDFPFYFVQLASHRAAAAQPVNESWAELREAQTLALRLPKTGMAVAIDVGDAGNIHPNRKREVGDRLAAVALADTYGKDIVFSGPLYKGMKTEGEKIRVQFDHTGGGLVAKGGPLKRFAIAGADKKFVWAEAAIDGSDVVVSSPQVPQPVAVRYAWADNPEGCNLYNQEGFPASPFRTDDWPGVTDTAHLPAPNATPFPKAPVALPPPPPSVKMTGNTLDIQLGKTIDRTWDEVKVNGYAWIPRQKAGAGETRIFLPYGNARGLYYELKGLAPRDPEPGSAAMFVSDGKGAGEAVLKLRFDQPIASFRLAGGSAQFQATNASAGFEYSVDGRNWKPISEFSQGGDIGDLAKNQEVAGLNTRDLYLRLFLRGKGSPTPGSGTQLRARNGGDPGWGDANTTFARAQWQLAVKPAK